MSRPQINVIDLDLTLIPYDSFTDYLHRPLHYPLTFLPGLMIIYLRKLRIITLHTQKKLSILLNNYTQRYDEFVGQYSKQLYSHIDKNVYDQVMSHSNGSTINILCSASPEDYVKPLAKKLGWGCIASNFDENKKFNHVYGNRKVQLIKKVYPRHKYYYNFAISDSISDKSLLKLFHSYELYFKD